jgi:hypothetical protein
VDVGFLGQRLGLIRELIQKRLIAGLFVMRLFVVAFRSGLGEA